MVNNRLVESLVGLFLIVAVASLAVLAVKVSGLTTIFPGKSYVVTAAFEEIGSLKIRAPVKIGGVQIGEVAQINLDPKTFKAVVSMRIKNTFNQISDDSSAGILTAGLLGDNYIAITPMYNTTFLKENSDIEITHSAMVLEKLIGQLIYKLGNSDKPEASSSTDENATKKPGDQHANP
jgi:phospholipid/cholesterol/gamma-HCH transport system substrate-binding protein